MRPNSAAIASTSAAAPCTPANGPRPKLGLIWDRDEHNTARVREWTSGLAQASTSQPPWAAYLRSVYGGVPDTIDNLKDLRWFWWWAPGTANLTRVEMPVWRSLHTWDAWVPGLRLERHLVQAGFFLQSAPRQQGYADGSVVEVMRTSHPGGEVPGNSSAFGPEAASRSQLWYWHAPGSGIGLRLGRTLAAPNRSELLRVLTRHLGTEPPTAVRRVSVSKHDARALCQGCTAEDWLTFDVLSGQGAEMCSHVRRAGFDTVQLFAAFGGQRFEIIDCRIEEARRGLDLTPTPWLAACPPPESRVHLVRAAAGGGATSCGCASALPFLNCGGCIAPGRARRRAAAQRAPWVAVEAPD